MTYSSKRHRLEVVWGGAEYRTVADFSVSANVSSIVNVSSFLNASIPKFVPTKSGIEIAVV